MKPVDVRSQLVEALRLDLVGPEDGLGLPDEVLSQAPARWYLTGFLVPLDAGDSQRADEDSNEEVDSANDAGGADDATPTEPASARRRFLPSSIGLSVLVPEAAGRLEVRVRWGDYKFRKPTGDRTDGTEWERTQRIEEVELEVPKSTKKPRETEVNGSNGLKVALSVRPVTSDGAEGGLPKGTRSVSVFLVNRRDPAPDETRDEAFAFQAQLEVKCEEPFVPRPNLRSLGSDDWDERVADLQYRDACEFAVGHSVATEAVLTDCYCHEVRTCWIPGAEVERVAPAELPDIELSMDALSQITDGADAQAKLGNLVTHYRAWIEVQRDTMPQSPHRRKETGQELLHRAQVAVRRMQEGIALLNDPQCLEAFRIANRGMATAARRRMGVMQNKRPESIQPKWRPFQLAFLLMNLKGIAEPMSDDREVVDLLFFPTGGGKTEAYLGLAAFTLVLRRLRSCQLPVASCQLGVAGSQLPVASCQLPVASCQLGVPGSQLPVASCQLPVASCQLGVAGSQLPVASQKPPETGLELGTENWQPRNYQGLGVLMRYTLRLLTLDQLGRASTLICALELER